MNEPKELANQEMTAILDGVTYTASDFLEGTKPFEAVYKYHGNAFQENQMLGRMAEVARTLKVSNFRKLYQAYVKSMRQLSELGPEENIAQFDQQDIELITGDWIADDTGVWKYGSFGSYEIACTHPIMPVERLRNIDTGELKVRLRFRRGTMPGKRGWHEILTDFDTISNSKNIVKLSQIGISVTSGKRAQNLVDYLADVMDLNYDSIPEKKSVSRLGWNEEGFSPYIGGIVFDGNEAFGRAFASIRPHGSFDAWKQEVIQVRSFSLIARILLASSFASVLVEPMGCLPFFVHLWGMASETGKTVGQMVAASVWGEPSPGGEYFKTFKSTTVGFEVLAGFFRSLPVFIDELQLAKDARGRVIFNVYELAAGAGKMRSNTKLGIAATPRWANCFITSGETPITGEQDGAGALNRVIEVECLAENKVIANGHRTAEIVKLNYGHAGKIFIEALCQPGMMEWAKDRYSELYEEFTKTKAADKQSHSAALITLADEIATSIIFKDDNQVTVEELATFLKSKEAISAAERGYAYICDWVSANAHKFQEGSSETFGRMPSETEKEDNGYVYIIRSIFNSVCQDAGISAPALLSHLRSANLIQTRGRALTKGKRINGIRTECVVMKLPQDDQDGDDKLDPGWTDFYGKMPFDP